MYTPKKKLGRDYDAGAKKCITALPDDSSALFLKLPDGFPRDSLVWRPKAGYHDSTIGQNIEHQLSLIHI